MIFTIILLAAVAWISPLPAAAPITPTFIARSQSFDASRKLVGVSDKTHLMDAGFYINFSVMPEYTQSMQSTHIAEALFGCDLIDCNKILIQGSQVTDRHEKAWLADYFYLAPDYNSYFTIKPVIQNALVNLDLYIGLDQVHKGMYARFYGPITYTKWNLNFTQQNCGDIVTTGSYSPGYFNVETISNFVSTNGMQNNQLLRNAGEFFAGQTPQNTIASDTIDTLDLQISPALGTRFTGLHYAMLQPCARSTTGFADLRGELGWNFCQTDHSHIGINFQIAAPTGNKRVATFAFDAVVGNGNHWELGGGLTAHYLFWDCADQNKHAGFYLDASFMHINGAAESRTFDLCGKPNSRYMLAMRMGKPDTYFDYNLFPDLNVNGKVNPSLLTVIPGRGSLTETLDIPSVTPQAIFIGQLTPVANITTMDVNVSSALQADIAAMFSLTSRAWSIDLGYNFYGRSAEKIRPLTRSKQRCCENVCTVVDGWALKGDARLFGYAFDVNEIPIRLSATQSQATIHAGTNATATQNAVTCPGTPAYENCGVDNPQFAYGLNEQLRPAPGLATIPSNHIKTSYQPVFINCCDVNFQATRAISNKLFGHIGYTWMYSDYKPYLGIGGSAEFGMNTKNDCCETNVCEEVSSCDTGDCCDTQCSPSLKSTLSQWGVWVKGGIEFN